MQLSSGCPRHGELLESFDDCDRAARVLSILWYVFCGLNFFDQQYSSSGRAAHALKPFWYTNVMIDSLENSLKSNVKSSLRSFALMLIE